MATRDELKSELMSRIDEVVPDNVEITDEHLQALNEAMDVDLTPVTDFIDGTDEDAEDLDEEDEQDGE